MAFVADYVFDKALAVFDTEANQLNICTQAPVTYTEAITTYSKGVKTAISIGIPTDATPNGRKVTVATFTDGVVNGSGTVTHYAIVDTVNSRLLATGSLTASQTVTSGNSFSLTAFDITIPDVV
jgi:hypothetical protein